MSIVNSILNLVDLNTTKYTKKLKQMRKDTKTATKGIGQSFASLGSAWKAAIAGIAAGALTGAITKELQATEKSVASFITATGSLAEARTQFEMLQQAARDTIQPFDSLKAVTLDLRKNGIQATAEQLKTFSQIAYGTGQSLETVGKAFTDTIQGKYEALNQLGIIAKDQGETLRLTYKGTTTEIAKNSAALSEYFAKMGKENEGVLEYLQGGVTGALNQLENAWGDFYRAIAESGFGQLITDGIRAAADALDGLTGQINENGPYFEEFFNDLGQAFGEIARVVKETTGEAIEYVASFFSDSQDDAREGLQNIGLFLSNFFKFARAGFLDYIAKPASQAWSALKGGFSGASEFLAELIYTGDWDSAAEAYNNEIGKAADEIADSTNTINKAIDLQFGEIDAAKKRITEKLAEKPAATPTTTPIIKFGAPQVTGGGKAAGRAAADTWAGYFARVQRTQRNGYSSVEKLRAEHQDELRELQEEYAKSSIATETEYQQARATLEAEFQRNIKEQRQEAADFLRSIPGDEEAQLAEDYRQKLEKLEQYHADALVSEEEFLQAQQQLRDDYEKERAKTREAKNDFFTTDDQKNAQQLSDALGDLGEAFGNLTTGMSESSGAYRALFATQKAFAVASATANAILAWSQALSDPSQVSWIAKLAQYANAIALTTGIISQLNSVQMHDNGGRIPAGQLGIVGEYGPELIQGPADVTSRKRTAELARQAAGGTAAPVTVNLYENAERAGQVEQQDNTDGERIINIFVSNIRRGGAAARAMENTYQLRRYGA